MNHHEALTSAQIAEAGLDDWRQLAGPIRARFLTSDFAQSSAFVSDVGAASAESGVEPEVTLTATDVIITLGGRRGRVSDRAIALAHTISGIAAEKGLAADTSGLIQAEFALDTLSGEQIAPFYAALLGGEPAGVHTKGDLVDPTGQVNTLLWWQEPRNDSRFPLPETSVEQSWHLDIWVAHDEVDKRIADALAAGGRLVSDAAAPSYWVLEDAEGNRACICAPVVE